MIERSRFNVIIMKINLLAFGIAKDIIGGQTIELELMEARTVEQLKSKLILDYPEFAKLKSLKLAVNGSYVEDKQVIRQNDEIVIIPPVSGG